MKLLFICTHNRCRSILAEAIANHYGEGLLTAFSAGSSPADKVHPLTIRALQEWQIPVEGLHSKSWDSFEKQAIDYVITVCDRAANEPCPLWFGKSRQVHWGLSDPSKIAGDDETIKAALDATITTLKNRVISLTQYLKRGPSEEKLYQYISQLADKNADGTV